MKTLFLIALITMCGCISAKQIYVYDENGNKIFFKEYSNVLYLKRNPQQLEKNMATDIKKLRSSAFKIDSTAEYYRMEMKSMPQLPSDLTIGRELLYEPDSTIQWAINQMFVQPKDTSKLRNILDKHSIRYKEIEQIGALEDEYLVTVKCGDVIDMANTLYETGEFIYAVPCFWKKIKFHNALYDEQWALNYPEHPNSDINAEEAWKLSSGMNTVVAILDCGIDFNHPDLQANLITGYDGSGNGGNGNISNFIETHGTRCAGVVAASDNSIGIKGVAYDAKLYPVKIGDANGVNEAYAIRGFNYARIHADIISCSWGGGSASPTLNNAINAALEQGRDGKGCVVIFATGNKTGGWSDKIDKIEYPANSNSSILAVGSTSREGKRSTFSKYGDAIDIVAPGEYIYTTTPISPISNDIYIYETGTSVAAPHVSGVAALMLSVNPDLTAMEVHDIICSTAQKLSGYSFSNNSSHPYGTWNKEVGHGLLDAAAAVRKAVENIDIIGPNIICDEGTYMLSALPAGATVEWSYEGYGPLIFPKNLIVTKLSENSARYERGEQVIDEMVVPIDPPIIIGTSTDAGTKPTAMPTEPFTGTKVITATISLNGAEVTLKKTVNVGTLTKPELLLNGFKYLYNEPMAPGKIGQTYTFSCENVDKGKLIWEVKAPGADPYTKTNVSSVSITPATSGAISVTVTNTDGCPEDNHASGTVVIMPSIVIDPINPVNPGITINARVWSERATGDDGGAMTKAAAAETARVPYEGGYTVELWDDRTMLGRWQREGHVMEIPGTGTLSGRIYYLRLYVDGELADVAKVMVY